MFDLVIRTNVLYSGVALSANVHGTIGLLHGGLWSFEARKKKKREEKNRKKTKQNKECEFQIFWWGNGNGGLGDCFQSVFVGEHDT